jgi:hypothetical protein
VEAHCATYLCHKRGSHKSTRNLRAECDELKEFRTEAFAKFMAKKKGTDADNTDEDAVDRTQVLRNEAKPSVTSIDVSS